jgi:hypothetical protein
MTRASLTRWAKEHPLQPFIATLAVVVLASSAWVGVQSAVARKQLAGAIASWQNASNQLATVRQQFRLPSSTESADLLREASGLGALGVPTTERVSLIELVSRLAEGSQLQDVRVAFRPPVAADSGFVPSLAVGSVTVEQAGYAISLDFTGSFSGLMQFVSILPPSLSISRMGAARQGDRGTYHVLLAVYEIQNGGDAK